MSGKWLCASACCLRVYQNAEERRSWANYQCNYFPNNPTYGGHTSTIYRRTDRQTDSGRQTYGQLAMAIRCFVLRVSPGKDGYRPTLCKNDAEFCVITACDIIWCHTAAYNAMKTRKALGERKPPPTLYVIFSVLFARWQHHIRQRLALSGNGKKFFNPVCRCWSRSFQKSNHLSFGLSLTFPANFSQVRMKFHV